jgi:hypothetical protein
MPRLKCLSALIATTIEPPTRGLSARSGRESLISDSLRSRKGGSWLKLAQPRFYRQLPLLKDSRRVPAVHPSSGAFRSRRLKIAIRAPHAALPGFCFNPVRTPGPPPFSSVNSLAPASALACCGSKVPRDAIPSITTFLSHCYGRAARPPQREADYRPAVMAGIDLKFTKT